MEKKEYRQLSRTTYNEYKAKLDVMKNERRLEVAQHIKEARAFGDISENAEYDAAMDEQAQLESDIVQLEELLNNVEVLDESNIDLSSVGVGTRVRLYVHVTNRDKTENDLEEEFDIVSTTETEPFRKRFDVTCDASDTNAELGYADGERITIELPPKMSNDSPVGHAILGHKVGEIIEVPAPMGLLKYEILGISKRPENPTGKYENEVVLS